MQSHEGSLKPQTPKSKARSPCEKHGYTVQHPSECHLFLSDLPSLCAGHSQRSSKRGQLQVRWYPAHPFRSISPAPALLCASAVPSWLTAGPPALRCALSTQQPERGQNPGPILSLRGWNPLKLESPAVAARPVCPHPRPVRPPLLSPLQTLCAPSTPAMSAWIGLCSQIPVGQKPRPAH